MIYKAKCNGKVNDGMSWSKNYKVKNGLISDNNFAFCSVLLFHFKTQFSLLDLLNKHGPKYKMYQW